MNKVYNLFNYIHFDLIYIKRVEELIQLYNLNFSNLFYKKLYSCFLLISYSNPKYLVSVSFY